MFSGSGSTDLFHSLSCGTSTNGMCVLGGPQTSFPTSWNSRCLLFPLRLRDCVFISHPSADGFAHWGGCTSYRSKTLWLGVVVAVLIFLPNVLWQWQHRFISLAFLRHIHERDVRIGRTTNFLPDQLELTLFAFPLAIAGLCFYFSPKRRRFRALGWMYVVPLVLFVLAKGRAYYLAAAYPMLYAAGAVWFEQSLNSIRWRPMVEAVAWIALAADIVITAVALPMAPPGSRWWAMATRFD